MNTLGQISRWAVGRMMSLWIFSFDNESGRSMIHCVGVNSWLKRDLRVRFTDDLSSHEISLTSCNSTGRQYNWPICHLVGSNSDLFLSESYTQISVHICQISRAYKICKCSNGRSYEDMLNEVNTYKWAARTGWMQWDRRWKLPHIARPPHRPQQRNLYLEEVLQMTLHMSMMEFKRAKTQSLSGCSLVSSVSLSLLLSTMVTSSCMMTSAMPRESTILAVY